jgi:hypothetical protein
VSAKEDLARVLPRIDELSTQAHRVVNDADPVAAEDLAELLSIAQDAINRIVTLGRKWGLYG